MVFAVMLTIVLYQTILYETRSYFFNKYPKISHSESKYISVSIAMDVKI